MSLVCFSPSPRCRNVVPSGGSEAPEETLDVGYAGTTPGSKRKKGKDLEIPISSLESAPISTPSHHKVSLTFCTKKKGRRVFSAERFPHSISVLFSSFSLGPSLNFFHHRDKHTQKVGLPLFGLAPSPSAYLLGARGFYLFLSLRDDIEFRVAAMNIPSSRDPKCVARTFMDSGKQGCSARRHS